MKVLIISHNVFSKTSNMGKTLSAYFENWQAEKLAQFYIHSEVPTIDMCKKYFRITDKEMLISIFSRRCGRIFHEVDIEHGRTNSRTDNGLTARMYQKARKRTPLIYLVRNLVWSLGKWNTKAFQKWVDDFNPDVVFFASGDYAFMYKIALKVAKRKQIPLIVSCMDDYFFYNKNSNRFLGKFVHKLFMRQVKKTMDYAFAIMSICDRMTRDYGACFNKPCYTIHTGSDISEPINVPREKKISYLGNLGYSRHLQLVVIGRTLKNLHLKNAPSCVDVYSAESDPEILKYLTPENGLCFHGRVNAEDVQKIIGESMAVIHTESFDEDIAKCVRYSVSTKIADSLASGTPMIAYGPENIASIEYLKENDAALVITREEDLKTSLQSFFENEEQRNKISSNAVKLARVNHIGKDKTGQLEAVLQSWKKSNLNASK